MLIKDKLWKILLCTAFFQSCFQTLSKEDLNKSKDIFYLEMEQRNLSNIEKMVNTIFIKNNINVSSELESLKMDILQDLSELETRLKPKKQAQIVRPVFKWGQTYRKIYIHLKYSHRFDAPGCLDVYNQTLAITREETPNSSKRVDNDEESEDQETTFTGTLSGKAKGRRFKFNAECQVADSVFRYLVEMNLLKDVTSWSVDKGNIMRKCGHMFDYSAQKKKRNLAITVCQRF